MKRSTFQLTILVLVVSSCQPVSAQITDNRTEIALLHICTVSPVNPGPRKLQDLCLNAFQPLLNNMTSAFPKFKLKIYHQCAFDEDTGSATKAFIEGYFQEPNKAMLLGMTLSQQTQVVADVLRLYYTPMLSYGSASPLLSDKSLYTTFTRLIVTHGLYNEEIFHILVKYNWRKIGLLITEVDQTYPVGVDFEARIPAYNLTVIYKGLFTGSARDILQRMKIDDVRIFVAFRFSTSETEPMECLINEFNLYGPKYQWIFSGWHGLPPTRAGGCTLQMKQRAVQNAITFDTVMADPNYVPPPSSIGVTMNDLHRSYAAMYGALRGSGSNATAARVFDTLTTAALALNDTLKLFEYSAKLELQNSSFKTSLQQNIRKQSFNGLEGPVQFDGNGDRISQVTVFQLRDNVAVPVATFDPVTNKTVWQKSLQFAGDNPPIDSPVVLNQRITISRPAVTVCLVLSAVGIGLAAVSVGVNLWYRNLKLIKLSSPNVNLVIALGCVLGYCSCIAMALNGADTSGTSLCWTQTCCLAAGYSCAFGAMFAKTWRVHVIFTNKRLKRLAIKDWHLFAVVGILLLLDAVVLVLWFVLDPTVMDSYSLAPLEDAARGIIYQLRIETCQSNFSGVWSGVLLGIKGLILIFGIFFAWETRKVQLEALNDSKQIGICVYNTLIMAAIGVSLSYVLPSSQVTLQFVLVSVCIIVCSTTTLLLVFGSKMIMLAQHGPGKVDDMASAMNTFTMPDATAG